MFVLQLKIFQLQYIIHYLQNEYKINRLMKQMSTIDVKKILNSDVIFQTSQFKIQQDKQAYIQNLLVCMLIKKNYDSEQISLNQFTQIIKSLGFDLSIQQIHELFIYSSIQFKMKSKITIKQKIQSFVTQEKRKINLELTSQWLFNKITNLSLKNNRKSINKTQKYISHIEKSKQVVRKDRGVTLPLIHKKPLFTLQAQLQPLINLFDQMEKIRQDSGLIPISFQQESSHLVQLPFEYIPYDPQLKTLNQNLIRLRIKAEQQLKRIIQLAKSDSNLKKKLESAIQKFQKSRIEINEKIGKNGAINAKKRLAQRKKRQINKLKYLNLDAQQDITKASRIYNLLNLPEMKERPIY